MIVERSSEKVNLHLIKRMVEVYDWLVLSAIIDAILLKTTDAVGPKPPIVLKTSGVRLPCSTSRIRWSYLRLFSCSCFFVARGQR